MLRTSLRSLASPSRHPPRRFYAVNAVLLANDNVNASSSSGSSGPHHHLPPPKNMNGEDEDVSDREWDLRTEGRAIDILQQTLPTFFTTGLVATNYHLPLHIHKILASAQKGKERAVEPECETCNEEGIYARTVRLEYTPPVALPAPLPRSLKVEGLPLYVASSVFLRHGMHAFYTDLAVAIRKVQIHNGKPPLNANASPGPAPQSPPPNNAAAAAQEKQRERSISIGLLVSGVGRLGLSNEHAEWDVSTTYTFSPRTGRIILHTVNAIHPAPSESVYAAFQGVLSALNSGFGPGGKGAMNVAQGKVPR